MLLGGTSRGHIPGARRPNACRPQSLLRLAPVGQHGEDVHSKDAKAEVNEQLKAPRRLGSLLAGFPNSTKVSWNCRNCALDPTTRTYRVHTVPQGITISLQSFFAPERKHFREETFTRADIHL